MAYFYHSEFRGSNCEPITLTHVSSLAHFLYKPSPIFSRSTISRFSPISSLLSPFLSSRDFGPGPTFLEPSPKSSVDRGKWQDHYFQDWSSADLHSSRTDSSGNEAFLSRQRRGRKTPSPQNHLYYRRLITFRRRTPVPLAAISLPSVESILALQSSIPTKRRWDSTAPDNSSLIIITVYN